MDTSTQLMVGELGRHRSWRFKQKHDAQELPPSPLAENLDPLAALRALRHYLTLRKPEGQLISAWSHVEYGMNHHLDIFDDDLRRKYMDDAMYLLAGIMGADGKTHVSTDTRLYHDALTLSTFLPLFTKRALGVYALRQDCEQLYASSGALLRQLLDTPSASDASSYRKTKLSETLARTLAARTLQPELLMYPASPREESSSRPAENHDGYFIQDGQKIPIQKKLIEVDKTYRYPTRVMHIERLAAWALIKAGIEPPSSHGSNEFPATHCLSMLVLDEIDGDSLSRTETSAINHGSRFIASHYRLDLAAA